MSILSTIITSLALAALALPTSAKSTDLTPETFKSSVSKGVWFIEHFSPYCGHCISFAPTWDKLANDVETEIPSVHLAQVNCVLHGDLCDTNGVKAYPTMQIFEDGKMVEQFKGARELDRLKAFILKHTKAVEEEEEHHEEPAQAPEVTKQPPRPILNPTGEVDALTSATFTQALARGPTFVKFFAPWCGHCKKLAPIWKQLARHMQNHVQIAQVNCDDESALCQSNNIKGYPTLVYFSNGAHSEYNGGRKLDQLKAFTVKASADGVRPLENDSDLDDHLQAEGVAYLLIYSKSDKMIHDTIREAAAPLLGSPVVYTTSSQALRTKYSIPQSIPWALLSLKDRDASTVTSALYGGATINSDDLKFWLSTHHLPGAIELTQDTFQTVMNANHHPLVVIASSNSQLGGKVEERIRDISKKWRVRTGGSGEVAGREVVFSWMDAQRWKDWMKSMYGITMDEDEDDLDDVKVVVADHKNLIYWKEDRAGSDLKLSSTGTLFAALEDISSGKVQYKHSENVVERLARYLNDKVIGLETYISEYPLRFVGWLAAFILIVFFLIYKLISNDTAKVERGEYVRVGKSDRID